MADSTCTSALMSVSHVASSPHARSIVIMSRIEITFTPQTPMMLIQKVAVRDSASQPAMAFTSVRNRSPRCSSA